MFMYNEEFEAKILAGIKSVTDEWNDFYRKPIIMPFSPEKMAKIEENVPELNSAVEFFTREVTMEYASNGLGEWIRALDLTPLANSKYIKRFVDIENMEKAIEQIESAFKSMCLMIPIFDNEYCHKLGKRLILEEAVKLVFENGKITLYTAIKRAIPMVCKDSYLRESVKPSDISIKRANHVIAFLCENEECVMDEVAAFLFKKKAIKSKKLEFLMFKIPLMMEIQAFCESIEPEDIKELASTIKLGLEEAIKVVNEARDDSKKPNDEEFPE